MFSFFTLQLIQGHLSSREAEAKMTLENHCCSSELQRLVVLHCKLFRFSKSGADRTEQGEKGEREGGVLLCSALRVSFGSSLFCFAIPTARLEKRLDWRRRN